MGNKMCKKKVDHGDGGGGNNNNNQKSPSPFDKIFARLHLKPKSWKSDSHLNAKQVNRYEINPKDAAAKNGSILSSQQMQKSKSSDWTDVELEVPEKDEAIQLKNPQLSFIFNDNSTPTPPPRKHKKSIREKIESVAKNGIQALQSKKTSDDSKKLECDLKQQQQQPVEEEMCVKKTIRYGCPGCDNRDCSHHHQKRQDSKKDNKRAEKEAKRKKNLSVVSLPNYNELKFSVANGNSYDGEDGGNLKHIDSSLSNSANSLPGESKKLTATPANTGKLENYMTRCRSFGSLLNNKLRTPKEPADNESDDSFGGLEDWDLGILEHYNPKDASLPRPRKPPQLLRNNERDVVLSDIEKLIVDEEETESAPPVRPVRRSESLIKKINREASEAAKRREDEDDGRRDVTKSVTPPPSPQSRVVEDEAVVVPLIPAMNNLSTRNDDGGKVEHSSLMRILQELSMKDAQQKRNGDGITTLATNERDFESNNANFRISNATANFINVEKGCVS